MIIFEKVLNSLSIVNMGLIKISNTFYVLMGQERILLS